MGIGIAITTFNRRAMFEDTLQRILEHSPADAPIVVVDDGSLEAVAVPERVTLYRFANNQGIATAKNKCLELLCETPADHFFLFDDDTYPTAPDWWRPYVSSPLPHLMHQFTSGPSHWRLHAIGGDDLHTAWHKPRGCMLYVTRDVVHLVGGMHIVFGKHGGEHGNWSERIHRAGLTPAPFMDLRGGGAIYCRDQDQAGISSVDHREHQQWREVDGDALPLTAPFRSHLPVLVPRRSDGGGRDGLWDRVLRRYWALLTDPRVAIWEGEHTEGPFNRSAAINAAARMAGDWDLAIIADADSWVPADQLRAAVALARRTGRLVAAFDRVHELTARFTDELMVRGGPLGHLGNPPVDRVRSEAQDPTTVQSTMLVVPRAVWDAVEGFDEKFRGWGGEDNAFWRACEVLTDPPLRVSGPAYHLWHPPGKPASRSDPDWQRNQWRWGLYANAVCAEQIRQLRA